MFGAPIFFPELAIIPLLYFESLLFLLTTSQVVHFAIVQILAVVGVGRQRILVVHHLVRHILDVVVYLIINQQLVNPTTRYHTVSSLNLFF